MIAKTATKSTEEKASKKGPYTYATGKRKTAVARVKIYPKGKGEILINERKFKEYFTSQQDITSILTPFRISDLSEKDYDVEITISGGGEHAGADACRHGISRALVAEDATRRGVLKKAGFLTRDSRSKERKKPGLKRARRAPQWSKR